MAFKMKGHELPGPNQKKSATPYTAHWNEDVSGQAQVKAPLNTGTSGGSKTTMVPDESYKKGSPFDYTGHWNDPMHGPGSGMEGEVTKKAGPQIQAPLSYTGHWNDPRMAAGTGGEGEVKHASGQATIQAPIAKGKRSPNKRGGGIKHFTTNERIH